MQPAPPSKELGKEISPRMKEALILVARGLSRQQIAERMVISRNALKNKLNRVYHRLGACNSADACVKAINQGIISIDEIFPEGDKRASVE